MDISILQSNLNIIFQLILIHFNPFAFSRIPGYYFGYWLQILYLVSNFVFCINQEVHAFLLVDPRTSWLTQEVSFQTKNFTPCSWQQQLPNTDPSVEHSSPRILSVGNKAIHLYRSLFGLLKMLVANGIDSGKFSNFSNLVHRSCLILSGHTIKNVTALSTNPA